MNNKKGLGVRDIVFIGMLSALCTIGTTIKIPYGNGAMVHLGSAAIYTIAIIFGRTYGGFAGAIGSGLFDLIMGFSPYTMWSFFIKGIAGYIVGGVAHSGDSEGKSIGKNIFACLMGATWTLGGYIVAWTAVIGKFEAALLNIPSSLITSGVAMIIAIPLSIALKKALDNTNLLDGIKK